MLKDKFVSIAKLLMVSILTGITGGITGLAFYWCIESAVHFRNVHNYMVFFMPVGTLLITLIYHLFRDNGKMNTNRIIDSVRENDTVPFIMAPLIFISTTVTQLVGGSAGKEGAALQIGGSIGYNLGKFLKLDDKIKSAVTLAGMSSVFTALFGTPFTAIFFPIEMIRKHRFDLFSFSACLISSLVSWSISILFGITYETMSFTHTTSQSLVIIPKILVLAVLCGIISVLFSFSVKSSDLVMKHLFKNKFLRSLIGALIVLALTLLIKTYDYNGAGMNIVERALKGEARNCDFILKIIFTALSVSAGFKGGKIVPAFFIGSTFGCVAATFLGIPEMLGASLGMIALFCGTVRCPVSSIILSVELFGINGIIFFIAVIVISYIISNHLSKPINKIA